MAKKIKMVVNGIVFDTKKALTEACRKILYNHPVGEELTEEETNFLTSLIDRYHPESDLKIGCGVKRMWSQMTEYGNQGFYLERHDGSKTDFSFVKCIQNPSVWKDFQEACRNAVVDDIQSFKKEQFEIHKSIICELTGQVVTIKTAHVDHEPPFVFKDLLRYFLHKNQIDYKNIKIQPTFDNKEGSWLDDDSFESKWKRFHKVNARLRIVSRLGNLSHSKHEAKQLEIKRNT